MGECIFDPFWIRLGIRLAPASAGPQNGFATDPQTDPKRIAKRIQNGSKTHPSRGKREFGDPPLDLSGGPFGGTLGDPLDPFLDPFAGPAGLGAAGLDPKRIPTRIENGSKTDP